MAFTFAGRIFALAGHGLRPHPPTTLGDASRHCTWSPCTIPHHFDASLLLRQAMAQEMGGGLWLRSLLATHANISLVYRLTDEQVIHGMAHLLRSGQVALLEGIVPGSPPRMFPMLAGGIGRVEEAPSQTVTPSRLAGDLRRDNAPTLPPHMHWIEIELVGEDDGPVAWEPYLVELPNGHRLTGTLDERGFARIDGIVMGGQCKVAFPQLDEDAWEYVRALPARGEPSPKATAVPVRH